MRASVCMRVCGHVGAHEYALVYEQERERERVREKEKARSEEHGF